MQPAMLRSVHWSAGREEHGVICHHQRVVLNFQTQGIKEETKQAGVRRESGAPHSSRAAGR